MAKTKYVEVVATKGEGIMLDHFIMPRGMGTMISFEELTEKGGPPMIIYAEPIRVKDIPGNGARRLF